MPLATSSFFLLVMASTLVAMASNLLASLMHIPQIQPNIPKQYFIEAEDYKGR